MMVDESAPTHKKRKLVKTYKNVLPKKRTVGAEVSREIYSRKCDENGSRKTSTDVITLQIKGDCRERMIQ